MRIVGMVFLFLLLLSKYSISQIGKFNIGCNIRIAYLPNIQSDQFSELNDIYGKHESSIILNTPISIQYNTNSRISFRYQLEYRREKYFLNDRYTMAIVKSNYKYLVNNFNILLKINGSKVSKTSINMGLRFASSFSKNYFYKTLSGDSVFSILTSNFEYTKLTLNISLSRETRIKNSKISVFRELFINTKPLNKSSEIIPIFYSIEFGFTLGLAYNLGFNKTTE